MNRDFELLDVDRITAEMYGVIIRGQDIHSSKNEMELLDELEEEIDLALDMIDFEFFAPSKEKFWENNLL